MVALGQTGLQLQARRRVLVAATAVCLLATASGPAFAARWLGLVVGVEQYADGGSVAGALDGSASLAEALRSRGATPVLLQGGAATRAAVLAELDQLDKQATAGDTVVLGFDGRGRSEPAAVTGGCGWSLALAGDEAAKLSGDEVAAFIRRVEGKGAQVLAVLDAGFGGTIPRSRSADGSRGQSAVADGGLGAPAGTSPPFARSTILAASDTAFDSPPGWWPGRAGRGRFLARAVAHAIAAGGEPGPALLSYTARVVYQLSAQRQQVAAIGADAEAAPLNRVATRGIVIKATARLGAAPVQPVPARVTPAAAEAGTLFPSALSPLLADPIKVAPAAGSPAAVASLLPEGAPARAVARTDDPDLIWDATYRNVLTPEGDLLADDIDRKAIPRIIDRTLAVRQLKAMVVDAPQQILLLPDDDVKLRGSIVTVEVGAAAGRSLILFNIRSDGKVQFLYPRSGDSPVLTDDRYQLPLRVSDPVGADAMVAITGTKRMPELEQGLLALNGQKAPLAAVKLVRDMALPGTQVGTVSIFSAVP